MALLLVLAACVGHTVLMVGSHNFFYGSRFPKWFGDVVHLTFGGLTVALPVALVALYGLSFDPLLAAETDRPWLRAYLGACAVVGAVWLPLLTLYRRLRREPVEAASSVVVDVAAELGRRPVGDGHHAFLAGLPGNEIFRVEFVAKTLRPRHLPAALDGLTVLHLSDLHFHGTPDIAYFEALLDRCAAFEPDLVCVTGDIADSKTHHEWIVPLLGRLRWKAAAFAILGNHDHRHHVDPIRRNLEAAGMTVLVNEARRVTLRGEPVVVVGDERPWLAGAPDFAGIPDGLFRLYLSHTPDNAASARRAGADLMLAGHVHGGQIRFPLLGSMLVPSKLGRRYDGGTYAVGEMILHVSRGVSGEHPVRYGCLPEVTLLTLRAG